MNICISVYIKSRLEIHTSANSSYKASDPLAYHAPSPPMANDTIMPKMRRNAFHCRHQRLNCNTRAKWLCLHSALWSLCFSRAVDELHDRLVMTDCRQSSVLNEIDRQRKYWFVLRNMCKGQNYVFAELRLNDFVRKKGHCRSNYSFNTSRRKKYIHDLF